MATLSPPADLTTAPLALVRDLVRISAAGFSGYFKKDCADLARRISLLAHLLEEIRDSHKFQSNSEFQPRFRFADLSVALQAANRLLLSANHFDDSNCSGDGSTKKIFFQFQCVTWKLEKALANLLYDDFDISEEVLEQVDLIRTQLRRSIERYGGPLNSNLFGRALSQPLDKEIDPFQASNRSIGSLHVRNIGNIDHGTNTKANTLGEGYGLVYHASHEVSDGEKLQKSSSSFEVNVPKGSANKVSFCKSQKPDSLVIPDEFLCPISLELMRDPVIVATGQTYERVYIQRWIDGGNTTCPKTQQKLKHLALTPNNVLRNIIGQWCTEHNMEPPTVLVNGRIKKSDGTFRDVTANIPAIEAVVHKLSSASIEECRAAVAEIRSLSKRSTDNRILLAEAGAIPILVNLMTSDDGEIQENAVTCILNLSIYNNNKGLIMLANAVPSIAQVLRDGSMEAKENAAATLFSLSLVDENKIIIGASGAIPYLVDLLQDGSARGKKDAAAALYNLCIYQGNKGRAVRAGIITALSAMVTDSSSCMVDEGLTMLSVLVGHHEAKLAIGKTSLIPVLVDHLRGGPPRNQENAAAILVSLCKRDSRNCACVSRLGGVIPLSEIANSGTERGRRKAAWLLEQLCKV